MLSQVDKVWSRIQGAGKKFFALRVHASPAETVTVAQSDDTDCGINLIRFKAAGDVAIQLERDEAPTVYAVNPGDEFDGIIKRVYDTDTTLANADMEWFRF